MVKLASCVLFFAASVTNVTGAAAAPDRVFIVPARCELFAPAPGPENALYWNQVLSLAACLEDTSVFDVRDPDAVELMVGQLAFAARPAMLLYRDALERAPAGVQLRAAYHVGLASVALLTRARASLGGDPATANGRALRAELEPLLAPTKQVAWLSFAVIDRQVYENPALESDAVSRSMIRSARAQLRALERDDEQPERNLQALRASR